MEKKLDINNMNGITGEEDKTCGLNDMNCLEGKEDKTCGLTGLVIRRYRMEGPSLNG